MATKLSNVIGAPFSDYVLKQLYLRAEKNSSTTRSNDEVLFLANKSAWARLMSSVNINLTGDVLTKFYSDLRLTGYSTPEALAQNWVLEAGTSIQTGNGITLRGGLGSDGAYGLGGTEELGYRPMPGLTSVQIETTGRLGSLRQATINFKVWNMNQLNIIEALYFRLGYSMLLEWGHTQYYENKNATFISNGIYGIDNPFSGLRKEEIQQAIAKKAKQTSGNYDGMLGIVSNFTWSFNQEGGYDCTVRLVGLGAVMDSMRINQAYKLPDGLVAEYKKNNQNITDYIKSQVAKQVADAEARIAAKNLQPDRVTDPVPTNTTQLLQVAQDYYGNYENATFSQFQQEFGAFAYTQLQGGRATKGGLDFYISFDRNSSANVNEAAQQKYGGLWLNDHPQGKFTRVQPNYTVLINTELIGSAISTYPPLVYVDGDYQNSNGQPYTLDYVSPQTQTILGAYLDYETQQYGSTLETTTEASALAGRSTTSVTPVNRLAPLPKALYNGSITYTAKDLPTYNTETRDIQLTLGWQIDPTSSDQFNYVPTKQQLIEALEDWINDSSEMNVTSIEKTGFNNITVKGTFQTKINDVQYSGPAAGRAATITANNNQAAKTVTVTWTLSTNNTGFIENVTSTTPLAAPNINKLGVAATGDAGGTVNQAADGSVAAAEGFASALDAMLTVIQVKGQASAIGESIFKAVDLTEDTKLFYKDGSLNGVLTTPAKASANPNGVPFDLVSYAQKGFNSSLFVDPTLYDSIPNVDFTGSLCYAYTVKYEQGSADESRNKANIPVYIQLGYLLAFLNNMCLIYDSTQEAVDNKTDGSQKRPYVYIDFNPETNFCLTSPQQFSIDPLICLVPLNATDPQFDSIFPSTVNLNAFKPSVFSPTTTNSVSQLLNKNNLNYKHNGNPFQGRTMNILLNTQYLLELVRSYAGADAAHAVNLQTFLERIMVDVNKCMGNINSFRVAYRDDTNTIQIQDDQWVPHIKDKDASLMSRDTYIKSLQTNKEVSGLLPIFNTSGNTLSIARQFQLKTTLSTKLASMIAISAQAATGSVNATDHSELSYLNQYYKDRYKPWIQDPSNGGSGTNTNTIGSAKEASNDQKLAQLFSDHVSGIYANVNNFSVDKIESAKNYYIERMSKVKSGDPITTAAPFIPAELEITLDGISGIIMGNAFTIPENRLPMSLRGNDSFTKVGFIVTGLSHTVDNNEWLTRIKGQMIKLRTSDSVLNYGAVQQITSTQVIPQTIASNSGGLTGAVIDDAVTFIKKYEGLASTKKVNTSVKNTSGIAYASSNISSDLILYPYNLEGKTNSDGTPALTIGWGTFGTYRTGVKANQNILSTDTITAPQAEDNLRTEVASINKTLTRLTVSNGITLTTGQAVALLDLGYNVGVGAIEESPLWRSLINKTTPDLNAMLTFRTSGFARALGERRKDEYITFLS